MSRITLAGNVAGTGILTVASPNTNTDHTLTLPDASGTIYSQGNAVGAVAQSGGVPTGAILEQGSNANGTYIRWADGTQMCWHSVSISTTVAKTWSAVNWTYPLAFTVSPTLFSTLGAPVSNQLLATAITPTNNVTCAVYFNSESPVSNQTVRLLATGRWF